ncbi:MFS transporter [Massilia sp. TS11]|uniref:MFS transporter n=1 Tax=Massilia sp. TS11 TaxID=2908003 RepID=UPI001EDB5D02|nr:MFS transporter [Massilia sp. TS11]MCG2585706.1 MFS transporter [Massilia sp. TS11]
MKIAAATPAFHRTNRAMLCAGFSTFALLYCVQPLMPVLAQAFALSPAQSSGVLSMATAALAVSLLVSGVLSDRVGRRPLMLASMLLGAVLAIACAFAEDYRQLLLLRTLLGVALGGMPAVAMAYLSEEIEPASLGLSMGLYISGSAFGGMIGRFVAAAVADVFGWRAALATMGVLALLVALECVRSLPASRHFRPQPAGWDVLLQGARRHLCDAGLPWMFAIGFLLMGCMVSVYNYIGYRLLAAPFSLRPAAVGALAALYLSGIYSAVWAGRRADRLGRRHVLWQALGLMLFGLLLTLAPQLPLVLIGLGIFTFGFFAAHSIASSWVGRRAGAPQALASALYLLFYYLGSSVLGSATGVLWSRGGWAAVVAGLGCALGLGLLIAMRLRGLAPRQPQPA